MATLGTVVALLVIICTFTISLRRLKRQANTTTLRGPDSPSFFYGWMKALERANDNFALYESWAHDFGLVYRIPMIIGAEKVVVMDPKAIGHIFAKDTFVYNQTGGNRAIFHNLVSSSNVLATSDVTDLGMHL
jgi:hypothetical protein